MHVQWWSNMDDLVGNEFVLDGSSMYLLCLKLKFECFIWYTYYINYPFNNLDIYGTRIYPSLNLRIQSISKFLIFCHLNRQISIINCFVKLILNLPSICFHGYQTFDNFFILHINVPMLKGHTITWLNKVNMAWIRIKKKKFNHVKLNGMLSRLTW